MYYIIYILFVKTQYFRYNKFGDIMKSIKKSLTHEIEIQKSRFICYIDIVHTEEQAKIKLAEIMKVYPGATHYCYAYIIDAIKRFQDDGEPSGTAGIPILHVLESQNLQHIIAVVIRYFGGIKLGAGGLVRAYTNSVSECLQKSEIVSLNECQIIHIEFDYNNTKQLDYLLQNFPIIKKEFGEKVIYEISSPKENLSSLLQSISSFIETYYIKEETIFITN